MTTDFTKREKIVGTFFIVIVVLLLATTIVIGRGKDWFRATITYYATFSEGYNLETGAAVKLFNTEIGKVTQIDLVGEKVKLKLEVFEEHASRIREGSVATVESPTFIGSEYVAIQPGPSTAAQMTEGTDIPTVAKKSLADIMQEFEVEKTAKMVVAAIQGVSETAQQLRRPDGPLMMSLKNIEETTKHLEIITAGLKAGDGTLGSLLRSREMMESVLARMDQASDILADVARATEKVPDTVELVQQNLETVQAVGLQTAEGIEKLNQILAEVDGTIDHVRTILKNAETGSYDIPVIIRSTRDGIEEIRDGVENANEAIDAIKANPLIRSNIPPPEPLPAPADAGLRQ